MPRKRTLPWRSCCYPSRSPDESVTIRRAMVTASLSEYVNGVPNICGSETLIAGALERPEPVFLPESGIDSGRARSTFGIALHMHQPLIAAGWPDLGTNARTVILTNRGSFGSTKHPY